MDGVDGVLCKSSNGIFQVEAHTSHEYPAEIRTTLSAYARGAALSAKQHGELQTQAANIFANVAAELASNRDVTAIGSHGQTVWHQPNTALPFSLQLDNPALIAARSNTAVVANFRNQDIAHGGQGAPLVPPFHQFLFGNDRTKAALNLGGIANITVLNPESLPLGYDIGPANCLADLWCKQNTGQSFDKNGDWGASGTVNSHLLALMLGERFFAQPSPKSTGLEQFNSSWLNRALTSFPDTSPESVQATLYQLTAELVAMECHKHGSEELIVCGGGAMNRTLMTAIRETCNIKLSTSGDYGVHPQQVEAAAFAWLAMLRIDGTPCPLNNITGTKKATCLGGLYLP